jgi:hypothetical protein
MSRMRPCGKVSRVRFSAKDPLRAREMLHTLHERDATCLCHYLALAHTQRVTSQLPEINKESKTSTHL